MSLRDYSLQLQQLLSETTSFDDSTSGVSSLDFERLRRSFNGLIAQFNREFNRSVQPFECQDILSMTSYFVSPRDLRLFKITIENMMKEIESLIQEEKNNSNCFHCFKVGSGCPHVIDSQKYLFFVGMPFNDQYIDSYQFGIKAMLDQHGIDTTNSVFKADEHFSIVDILCKICKAIQESQYIIINISDQNPNVMFELGLAYGLNKKVFLIKDEKSAVASDLKGLEYTQYSNAGDLAGKLETRFRELGIF